MRGKGTWSRTPTKVEEFKLSRRGGEGSHKNTLLDVSCYAMSEKVKDKKVH